MGAIYRVYVYILLYVYIIHTCKYCYSGTCLHACMPQHAVTYLWAKNHSVNNIILLLQTWKHLLIEKCSQRHDLLVKIVSCYIMKSPACNLKFIIDLNNNKHDVFKVRNIHSLQCYLMSTLTVYA